MSLSCRHMLGFRCIESSSVFVGTYPSCTIGMSDLGEKKMMDSIKLTREEAFWAMYSFLESYYSQTKSDDIGALLGSLSMLADGVCADSAMQGDWNEAVQKAVSGGVDANFLVVKR